MDERDRREFDILAERVTDAIRHIDSLQVAHKVLRDDVDGMIKEDAIEAEVARRIRLSATRRWSMGQKVVVGVTAIASVLAAIDTVIK